MDPSQQLVNIKQQIVAGQSITFPANLGEVLLLQCQATFYWMDLATIKNITCKGEMWSQLPPPCIGIMNVNFLVSKNSN